MLADGGGRQTPISEEEPESQSHPWQEAGYGALRAGAEAQPGALGDSGKGRETGEPSSAYITSRPWTQLAACCQARADCQHTVASPTCGRAATEAERV